MKNDNINVFIKINIMLRQHILKRPSDRHVINIIIFKPQNKERKMKYYEMQHRGSLEEALKTKKEISQKKFSLIKWKYEFYCYDKRINCNRYILRDMEEDGRNYPIWLLEEKNEKKTNNDK